LKAILMGRTRTVVTVPIQQSRCGGCAHLETTIVKDAKGRMCRVFRCPRNRVLPAMVEPFFAVKCGLFKAGEGG
jgi:hypothetical protein